jgi:hypothetical protein
MCRMLVVAVVACAPHPVPMTRADRHALKRDARAAYVAKDYATCSGAFERAAYWYDAASCHALAGRADAAFADLDRALAGPFHDVDELPVDEDLAKLHADPRWTKLLAAFDAKRAEFATTANAELLQIYTDDQGDRMKPFEQIDWKVVAPRDTARRKRVDEILAAGGARTADDYFHAAMVFQHGEPPDDFQRAHDLAVKAAELDPDFETARWLAAAALDRKLMSEHKPQKYGTQFQSGDDGVWHLYDVDPTVTDAEREQWSCPPLAAAKARAAAMNQK